MDNSQPRNVNKRPKDDISDDDSKKETISGLNDPLQRVQSVLTKYNELTSGHNLSAIPEVQPDALFVDGYSVLNLLDDLRDVLHQQSSAKPAATHIVIDAKYPRNDQKLDMIQIWDHQEFGVIAKEDKAVHSIFDEFKKLLVSAVANDAMGDRSSRRTMVPEDVATLIARYHGPFGAKPEKEVFREEALRVHAFMKEKLYQFVRTQSPVKFMWFSDHFEKISKLVFRYYFSPMSSREDGGPEADLMTSSAAVPAPMDIAIPVPTGAPPVPMGAASVPMGGPPVPMGAAPVPMGAAPVPIGAVPAPMGTASRTATPARRVKQEERWNPKQNMKPFHWKKISPNALRRNPHSVWNAIDDRGLDLDFEALEARFHKSTKKELRETRRRKLEEDGAEEYRAVLANTVNGAPNRKSTKSIAFIADLDLADTRGTIAGYYGTRSSKDRKAAVRSALFLEKRSFQDIRRWIITVDEEHLSEEDIRRFHRAVPSEAEMAAVCQEVLKQKWTEREWPRFEMAEAFWWTMRDVPQIQRWLSIWVFRLDFEPQIAEYERRVTDLRAAMRQITDSEKLRVILRVVLGVGNYMNSGTRLGNADGVRLSALQNLSETRGVDSDYSLLTFVYEQVVERFPEAEDFDRDLDLVAAAGQEEVQWLHGEFVRVQAQVANKADELEAVRASWRAMEDFKESVDDKFDAMAKFVEDVATRADDVKAEMDDLMRDIGEMTVNFDYTGQFGGNESAEGFFQLWADFMAKWKAERAQKRRTFAIAKRKRLKKAGVKRRRAARARQLERLRKEKAMKAMESEAQKGQSNEDVKEDIVGAVENEIEPANGSP